MTPAEIRTLAAVERFAVGAMGNGEQAIFKVEQEYETGFMGRRVNGNAGIIAKPGYISWSGVICYPTLALARAALLRAVAAEKEASDG